MRVLEKQKIASHRSLVIKGRSLPYILRESGRARRLRLTVYPGQYLLVTKPKRVSLELAERFILSKADWVIRHLESKPARFQEAALDQKSYQAKRLEAHALINARLAYFNSFYNFKYQKVTVRNQATRWGSCSRRANLNFNVRLLDLPEALRDYIIVHELCHLKEFNHSERFWSLVAQTQVNYLTLRRQLKAWSLGL
ncbi:MAG: M48 family metallopeptidase [Patescibacteria group bacterium]